ncbi:MULTISPECIES: hypothetical protein [unclassified Mesorhizobium]|uniref:hypothetical protein n=1 Tax=unclassified Mesorhizobium TaxID=325217 RepID=UPI0012EB1616|nr:MULTISPECIES: hypothetical protein [unclassified Mesorhizobium]WJI79369.1 hypothetical protein NLY34_21165 [Mesorhizobium sp. C374B]WJI85905.1 hypothetical protein NLY42_23565 [Mesorhizobium sp. C372A]
MKSRQKKIHLAPLGAEANSSRSIFRTSKNNRKDDEIRKLGKRLRKRDGVAKVLIKCRSEFSALSQAHHNHVRESTIAIYAAALLLVEDRSSWAEFCRHRDWRKRKRLAPRVGHPEDALRASVRLAVGFKGKRATRRSSRLYKLLEPFFARATPMREVAAIARDRGLKGLAEVGTTFKDEKRLRRTKRGAQPAGLRWKTAKWRRNFRQWPLVQNSNYSEESKSRKAARSR